MILGHPLIETTSTYFYQKTQKYAF